MVRAKVGGSQRQNKQVPMTVMSLMGRLIWKNLPEEEEMAEKSVVKNHKSAGPLPTSTDPTQDLGTTKFPGQRPHSLDT